MRRLNVAPTLLSCSVENGRASHRGVVALGDQVILLCPIAGRFVGSQRGKYPTVRAKYVDESNIAGTRGPLDRAMRSAAHVSEFCWRVFRFPAITVRNYVAGD